MKILVVGGTGMVGGNAAIYLQQQGHDVAIMSRNAPTAPGLVGLPFIQGDYIADTEAEAQSGLPATLSAFDALVFAAAVDVRYLPQDGSVTAEAFYHQANTVAVPRFFALAQAAGIKRCVYLGSFYPIVAPERIEICPYVRSRHSTDQAVLAMSRPGFNVCSLNAPFILGYTPGLSIPHLDALVQYASGSLAGVPVFSPLGGTNHISSQSVSEAILGALLRGETGKSYLIGDENYNWKDYLELWFTAAGNPQNLAVSEDDHPMLPNAIMFAGAGATVSYEPDPAETELLGYGRNRIAALIKEMVAHYQAV